MIKTIAFAGLGLGLALTGAVAAPITAPITGVTATASSSYGGDDRAAIHTVDGSGINPDGSASTSPVGTMWLSNGAGAYGGTPDTNQSITFNLGSKYTVATMRVWNYNESSFMQRGIATADIFTSNDNVTYTLLKNVTLSEAPGTMVSDFSQYVTLNATAQYIRIGDITNFLGDDNAMSGLSEVQFSGTQLAASVPEPASLALLGMGVAGLAFGRRRARRD